MHRDIDTIVEELIKAHQQAGRYLITVMDAVDKVATIQRHQAEVIDPLMAELAATEDSIQREASLTWAILANGPTPTIHNMTYVPDNDGGYRTIDMELPENPPEQPTTYQRIAAKLLAEFLANMPGQMANIFDNASCWYTLNIAMPTLFTKLIDVKDGVTTAVIKLGYDNRYSLKWRASMEDEPLNIPQKVTVNTIDLRTIAARIENPVPTQE